MKISKVKKGEEMEIKRATFSDIDDVLNLVHACIKDMNEHGMDQWNDIYPKDYIFGSDIEKGTLFTVKNEETIVGIIVLSREQDKEYEAIHWSDGTGKFILVHRLAVHPKWQRQGIATQLMDFAEAYGRDNGFTSIRIDTYSHNPRTLTFFEKRGYERKKGEIFFPETDKPYYCYEIFL
jgi:ribosomal protein S18 acetylase RimI-like enzyme